MEMEYSRWCKSNNTNDSWNQINSTFNLDKYYLILFSSNQLTATLPLSAVSWLVAKATQGAVLVPFSPSLSPRLQWRNLCVKSANQEMCIKSSFSSRKVLSHQWCHWSKCFSFLSMTTCFDQQTMSWRARAADFPLISLAIFLDIPTYLKNLWQSWRYLCKFWATILHSSR